MFHDVRLPQDIERGATGGPQFSTTVLQLRSGFEQRNINWTQVRGQWDIAYGILQMAEEVGAETAVHTVRDFFYARQGRAVGFRFKDWSDFEIGDRNNPTADNQSIGLGDGATTVFQVFKRYTSGGFTYDRTIKKLVTGTPVVLLDGIVQVSGFTVDVNAGTVTFNSAPANNVNVQVATEFDVPVRFDSDQLQIRVEVFQAGEIVSTPIVELRLT